MDDWLHDYNAGKASRMLTRRLIWRERFDRLRKWGWPIATAAGCIALWLHSKGIL